MLTLILLAIVFFILGVACGIAATLYAGYRVTLIQPVRPDQIDPGILAEVYAEKLEQERLEQNIKRAKTA